MNYSSLRKQTSDYDWLVFFDVEGTQFSHSSIAIGLVAIKQNKETLLFDKENMISYHSYIKTKDKIGPYVEKMTGITSSILKKEGKDFSLVLKEINSLLSDKKKLFISYGNGDINMINGSIDHKDEFQQGFYRYISKNYFDFHHFLSKRILDDNGQSLSIERLMKLFSLSLKEKSLHNPLYDSLCLLSIYDYYVSHTDEVALQVMNHLPLNKHLTKVSLAMAKIVIEKGSATKEDLLTYIKEYL